MTIRIGAAILLTATLSACCDSEACRRSEQERKDYKAYRAERTVAKICRSGTNVYSWRGELWTYDGRQYPDAKITVPLAEACE